MEGIQLQKLKISIHNGNGKDINLYLNKFFLKMMLWNKYN